MADELLGAKIVLSTPAQIVKITAPFNNMEE